MGWNLHMPPQVAAVQGIAQLDSFITSSSSLHLHHHPFFVYPLYAATCMDRFSHLNLLAFQLPASPSAPQGFTENGIHSPERVPHGSAGSRYLECRGVEILFLTRTPPAVT